jgi:hypothetical protein
MLYLLGCLRYSPPLESHIHRLQPIKSGSTWEIELRGASIWCVELIKQEIERMHPESRMMDNHNLPSASSVEEGHEDDKNKNDDDDDDNTTKSACGVNAILIDFFLYDTMKQLERDGRETIPHHRTRGIWY